jgi:hypothetical protein
MGDWFTNDDLSASLSALPPEASCDPAHLVSLEPAGVARPSRPAAGPAS